MSTTIRVPRGVDAHESPFEMPALTSGYPFDAAEKAAIRRVLDAAGLPVKARPERHGSDDPNGGCLDDSPGTERSAG